MPEPVSDVPQDITVMKPAARNTWLWPALLAAFLLAIAGGFWSINGASVFAQMLASAWAFCF